MGGSNNRWPQYQLADIVEARRDGKQTPMDRSAEDWSTYQLTEFMAMVSASQNEPAAVREAVERAAETLGAEVAAVVASHTVKTAVGFPAGQTPEHELVAIAEGRQDAVDVPGLGTCRAVAVLIEGRVPAKLVLARLGDESFGAQEVALLRGMARVLALTQRMLHVVEGERRLRDRSERQARENADLLTALQERQRLLERLTVLQASISRGAPFGEVAESVVSGAQDLVGDPMIALRLLDPRGGGLRIVASIGVASDNLPALEEAMRLRDGSTMQAFASDGIAVVDDYPAEPDAMSALDPERIHTVMAAPVHDHDRVIGALVVASRTRGRTYSRAERDALLALARHASIALADASREAPLPTA